MTDYPLDMQLVVDPENPENVVRNSPIYFYDPADEAGLTPIEIRDPSGLPMTNPLTSNNYGYITPTIVTIPRVKWKSGPFEGFFYSYDGLRNEAVAARAAAEESAAASRESASSAQASASLVKAPPEAAVTAVVTGETEARAALDLRYTKVAELDEDTGAHIRNQASDTRAALDDTYATLDAEGKQPVRKGEIVRNAKDYGVVGDGIVDDTAALNDAAAQVFAISPDAELYIPPGTYKTTGTVTVKCGLNASQATISYTGSGTALILGSTVVGSSGAIQRRTFKAPRVLKTGTGWDGTSIGILAANLVSCEVHVPFVYQFEQGLVCQGFGTGFVHNNIHLGALWGNHKNLVLTQDADGWCNSNQFFGGRLAYGTAWSTVDDLEGSQLSMIAPAGATAGAPNNNTFWGTSFEAGDHVYYRVTIGGRYNVFHNCRWEALGGSTPRVRSLATADKNVINGGYDVFRIVDVVEAGGKPPALVNAGSIEYHAHAATAKTFTASGASNEQLMDTWTQLNGVQCTHAAGLFTPRAGIWKVKVTLGISCASASGYRQLTLKKGASLLDVDRKSGFAGLMTLTVESTEIFNGTETFAAYFDQNSPAGSDVTLSTTARFCRVQAVYLGAA